MRHDKSGNVNSDGQETTIIDSSRCGYEAECEYRYGGCGVTVCFKANNDDQDGITPQDSTK